MNHPSYKQQRDVLLASLEDMVRYITTGEHYNVRNPYMVPQVVAAMKAVGEVKGMRPENWREAVELIKGEKEYGLYISG